MNDINKYELHTAYMQPDISQHVRKDDDASISKILNKWKKEHEENLHGTLV